jgi:tetrahydromethanopterin S-methyltransferase subunit G
MENEIEIIEDRIERLQKTNAEYQQRYGTGTRPSWVGEEIGINLMYIDIARQQIAALKGEDQ